MAWDGKHHTFVIKAYLPMRWHHIVISTYQDYSLVSASFRDTWSFKSLKVKLQTTEVLKDFILPEIVSVPDLIIGREQQNLNVKLVRSSLCTNFWNDMMTITKPKVKYCSYGENKILNIIHVPFYLVQNQEINRLISLVGRVFANGPGDLGSIPGRVIPKTLIMVFDTSLVNTQQYKYQG